MDLETAARGARNQALYRDVNERVKEINEAFSLALPLGDWLCECADPECSERIALTSAEYEWVRADPRRFAIAPGDEHLYSEIEDVVESNERFWVVEKRGPAGDLVAKIDPRSTDRPLSASPAASAGPAPAR